MCAAQTYPCDVDEYMFDTQATEHMTDNTEASSTPHAGDQEMAAPVPLRRSNRHVQKPIRYSDSWS